MLTVAVASVAFSARTPVPRHAVASRVAPASMHADGLAATAVQWTLALPTMYALMSANEYMTHRYFQHLEFNRPETMVEFKQVIRQLTGIEKPKLDGDGHVEHHAETFDDMSLKNDERWRTTPASKSLDEDEFRGTAFHWEATGIMTIQMLPSVLPTYALMGWSVPETFAILLPTMLLHALVWNAIHPPMHGLPRVPATVGAPSWVLADALLETPYAKYIYENHMGHHVLGGQCNYNVCCPMTDHLLGTFVPTDVWSAKMRAIPEGASVRGPVVEPPGVPKPPTWEEQKAARAQGAAFKGVVAPTALAGGGSLIADAYTS